MKKDLVDSISRILPAFRKLLAFLSKVAPQHIQHKSSWEMAEKSQVKVLDMLLKSKAEHSDILDVIKVQLGSNYVSWQGSVRGGQLTCERQMAAQCNVMDGDTRDDRLELHCLRCFLGVSLWNLQVNQSVTGSINVQYIGNGIHHFRSASVSPFHHQLPRSCYIRVIVQPPGQTTQGKEAQER